MAREARDLTLAQRLVLADLTYDGAVLYTPVYPRRSWRLSGSSEAVQARVAQALHAGGYIEPKIDRERYVITDKGRAALSEPKAKPTKKKPRVIPERTARTGEGLLEAEAAIVREHAARSARQGDAEDDVMGSWAADDLRRAFVAGGAWWEFTKTGATIWPSGRDAAEDAAEQRYPGGRPRAGASEAASADAIDTPNVATPAPTATTGTEDALRVERDELFQDTCDYLDTIGHLRDESATLRAEVEGLADTIRQLLLANQSLHAVAEAARDVHSYLGIDEDDGAPFLIDTGHGEAADAIAKLAAALAALPQPTKDGQ